ncbi:MAG: hypothetical protein Q8L56_13950 [Rhodocyclaceae bacterium]|nr:hypothetical protein [Rhodocyclaceae bacterium]
MGIFDWLKSPPPIDAGTLTMIGHAMSAVDPLIRQVPGYQRKLAPAVRHALDYCTDIVARIPGPFEISRAAFASDPVVHALFASADDVEAMLATNQCARDLLHDPRFGSGQCCAMLGMRHREKAGFGAQLSGNVLRRDEPQKALYFTDHTLTEPGPDLDTVKNRLRIAMFDSLLKSLADEVAVVRAEQTDLNKEHAIESAWARSGQSSNAPESHTRRLDALRARLRSTADALQPKNLLDTLIACLAAPEPYLRIAPVTVSVDRTGIITAAGAGEPLHFAELTGRDQRRWAVMLVLVNQDEARRALERFESTRRHIII